MAHQYFAYGSNMHPGRMSERCPGARFVALAELPDTAVVIGHRGVATIVGSPGTSASGVVWSVSDGDIRRLDAVEGVHLGVYRRETREALIDGVPTAVIVYVEPFEAVGMPRPGYLETILEGAAHFGLPPEYQTTLAGLATQEVGR